MGAPMESILLNDLVKLYIKVRGFGLAKPCVELYKQTQHETKQKKSSHGRPFLEGGGGGGRGGDSGVQDQPK